MKLEFYKNNWGEDLSVEALAEKAASAGFAGLEIESQPATEIDLQLKNISQQLGLKIIGEVSTASDYVLPRRDATVDEHIDSLREQIQALQILEPVFVNSLSGCDAWSDEQNLEFFGKAIELEKEFGIVITHETHRGRSLFNPWVTQRVCTQLPDLKLCADYSHWCVVAERILEGEEAILASLAKQVYHVHARVGYDQGPQVPDPRAPEYAYAVEQHQTWWRQIWQAQYERGDQITTMNPEWGVDGYMHEAPYTQQPVADLWDLQLYTLHEQTKQFEKWGGENVE